MSIPGLSQLKTWGLVIVSGLALVAGFLWKASQLARVKEKTAGIIRSRNKEREDVKVTLKGMRNEQKAKDNINLDDDDRII